MTWSIAAFVPMPNHVHLLVVMLGRTGLRFWQAESYDPT